MRGYHYTAGLIERPDHPISTFRGDEIVKTYSQIGEVAEKFGVNPSSIRFYVQEFGLNIKINRKGNRQFTAEDIETLGLLIYLADRFKLEYVRTLWESGRAETVRGWFKELEAA